MLPKGLLLPALAAFALAGAACGDRGRVLSVDFETAPGLREGTRVSFRGVPAGVVQQVRFVGDRVRVEMLIQRDDAPIHAGDVVRLRPMGILGDNELEIVPGPAGAPVAGPETILRGQAPEPLSPEAQAVVREITQAALGRLFRRESAGGSSSAPGAPSAAGAAGARPGRQRSPADTGRPPPRP